MATIKSYTDIEQSKLLAKILPLESADMCWFEGEPFVEAVTGYEEERAESHRQAGMEMYPCWSLAALISVLPKIGAEEPMLRKLYYANEPKERYICEYGLSNITSEHDNPIDACYEMIINLHELKLL